MIMQKLNAFGCIWYAFGTCIMLSICRKIIMLLIIPCDLHICLHTVLILHNMLLLCLALLILFLCSMSIERTHIRRYRLWTHLLIPYPQGLSISTLDQNLQVTKIYARTSFGRQNQGIEMETGLFGHLLFKCIKTKTR